MLPALLFALAPQDAAADVVAQFDETVSIRGASAVPPVLHLARRDRPGQPEQLEDLPILEDDELQPQPAIELGSWLDPGAFDQGTRASRALPDPGPATVPAAEGALFDMLVDPGDGDVHFSVSADGSVGLVVSRGLHGERAGHVYVVHAEQPVGHMRNFDALRHACISEDGVSVFVDTGKELQVYSVERWASDDPPRRISMAGRIRTEFSPLSSGKDRKADSFLLVHELGVELYRLPRGAEAEGPIAPLAFLETRSFAMYANYLPDVDLFVVVERDRVRLMRVRPTAPPAVLGQYRLDGGEEFRSGVVDRFHTLRPDAPEFRLAVGLRRAHSPARRERAGSCDLGVLVLALRDGELLPLQDVVWQNTARWSAYSPELHFVHYGSRVLAHSRDKAWVVGVVE